MSYPMLVNWAEIKKVNRDKAVVKDGFDGACYTLDGYTAWFASKLDGKTDPYKIDRRLSDDEVEELLDELDDMDLLRCRRVLVRDFPELYLTLWIPRESIAFRIAGFIFNKLLLLLWLPVFVISIFCFFNSSAAHISDEYMILGNIIGLIMGAAIHEFSHMFACLAYGGRVFEIGFFINGIFPGGYTLMNVLNIKKRMHRVQISAAGIESNFLLAGIVLFLVPCSGVLSGLFLQIAVVNIFLATLNLLMIDGVDGMAIIGELLGIDDLADKAKMIKKSKAKKRKIARKGITGKLTVAVCYIISVVKIAIPIVLILNVVELILCLI